MIARGVAIPEEEAVTPPADPAPSFALDEQ